MNAVAYYLALPFIYLLSYSPFWVMYRISDVAFVILYYLIGYRKQVVLNNLRNSFPEKSEKEIKQICKEFYHYFCDLILETLKTLTISPSSLRKRVRFEEKDKQVFSRFLQQDQSVLIVMGHWGNWELAGARFAVESLHPLYIVYHPLRNPYFEKLVYHMRTRLGNGLFSMKDTLREMVRHRKESTATAFIADQTPHNLLTAFWTEFLGQDTPVFPGPEVISQKFDYPVIYVGTRRVKRGYYQLHCELLVEAPKETDKKEITDLHIQRLEKNIRKQPEIWLWTHRRWKHQRPTS
ncbi:lysophospholipid acyltransferase family protein [Flavilitoribacter nigricans]|uniref:Lipid A biosynthesis acyltransferase n=1 Tax=Flavilitoribacter nigricans (strain ATCC 23147 / DSM 23189 / NBRC 102662 / NCIMB 1420 / SS-2) TaxID=1122177 RepID=A0A2D0N4E8_FLAN2|nr:lysophospholipid acyltransferase family protein [Flavilitoribacter nigricans]PHN03019.1 lipid A biosynthesis acyltransferase [Flavilitoribacter nigricans DSM 23189 = NBRC 102662]